ncbi:nitrogenase associated protein [Methanocella paludicola SANAE]|uniref:Nitrogenase associated protein n=1 Tax=Methanocella paludicola (strain DSM 17711 / JCM 13418 / NBRC 101707 / SANAE) TaxID=304371 RepID=D1YX04_METPS|nr:nitrogenase component 1 [Methanocella paludicola]BAI60976.1 nitrogenase associated protein [Methanocella paludicola SANAE]
MDQSKQSRDDKCNDPYLRCAFNGAAQTALGVSRSALLAHSPQGCEYLVNNAFAWQECDYMETMTLCTKLCVDEIVHGGEDLLMRTIREAKDLKIDALFVLSACGPEIVGDDIVAVCEDMQPEVDFKLIPIQSPGFKGSQYDGIDIALDTMIKRLANDDGEKIPNSVCLIAPHANANPTWMADLEWVKQVLSEMGVKVVATLSHKTPLSDIENVPSAEASLILSHDAGQRAADYLSAKYGIEQVCKGMPLPIGMTNTQRWLNALGERFDAQKKAEKMVEEGERMVTATCRRKWPMARFFYRTPAAIVADATVGIPLVRFVTEEMEMTPELVALYSSRSSVRDMLEGELKELGLKPNVVYGTDVYKTRRGLMDVRPKIVFGSTIERHASEGLGVPYTVEVVRPMRQFRLINRAYFGYTGILNLFECVQNEWVLRWRSKDKRYEAKW